MYTNINKVSESIRGTNCEVNGELVGEEIGKEEIVYKATFKHHDLNTIMGMIVYLQDNFLNEMQGPKLSDNDFLMRQARFLVNGMDVEQMTELRNYLSQEIEYKLEAINEAKYESEVVHSDQEEEVQ